MTPHRILEQSDNRVDIIFSFTECLQLPLSSSPDYTFFFLFLLPLSYYQIVALQEQSDASAPRVVSNFGEYSPLEGANTQREDNSGPLPPQILQVSADDDSHRGLTPPSIGDEFHIEGGCEVVPSVEHQFITSFSCKSVLNHCKQGSRTDLKSLLRLRDESEGDLSVSLQLGKHEPKRRKQSDSP